jgi:hypothetical protein
MKKTALAAIAAIAALIALTAGPAAADTSPLPAPTITTLDTCWGC